MLVEAHRPNAVVGVPRVWSRQQDGRFDKELIEHRVPPARDEESGLRERVDVARRRGFLAEVQHQIRLSEQRQRTAARQHEAAQRRSDAARRAAERASAAVARASEADRKRLEREAAQAHAAARQEEVDELNAEVAATYTELDGILTATLSVDDFVDLEKLRAKVELPPFEHPELLRPTVAPDPIIAPPEPTLQAPASVGGVFGRKKKEAEAAAAAERQYAEAHQAWRDEVASIPQREAQQAVAFDTREQIRLARLAREQAKYAEETKALEDAVAAQNADLDELISGLAYGVVEAVQEYVGIVAANSVYPELLPVSQTSAFDAADAELTMRVLIPGPEDIPTIKGYRYVKAADEIVSSAVTQKEAKDRYAGILHNVALRTLHEVFEADRRGLIGAISLEVGTEALNTATGRPGYVPLLAVAATRAVFEQIDLSAVVPAATLQHLGAAVSKNPQALSPVAVNGVRRA